MQDEYAAWCPFWSSNLGPEVLAFFVHRVWLSAFEQNRVSFFTLKDMYEKVAFSLLSPALKERRQFKVVIKASSLFQASTPISWDKNIEWKQLFVPGVSGVQQLSSTSNLLIPSSLGENPGQIHTAGGRWIAEGENEGKQIWLSEGGGRRGYRWDEMKKGRNGRDKCTSYNLSHMVDLKNTASPVITAFWFFGFFMA